MRRFSQAEVAVKGRKKEWKCFRLFLWEPVFMCTETFRCVVMEANVTHTNTHSR